jgi:hypothetical protein
LWQAIQVAAGMSWKPRILFADISTLPDLHQNIHGNGEKSELENENTQNNTQTNIEVSNPNSESSNPNFQALIQYIQTAGFRGSIALRWTKVLQQLQYQSVDLILLCLRDTHSESPSILQALSNLRQMTGKPPILVLDYRCNTNSESEAIDFLLQEVSAQILPSCLSVAQLLEKIQQSIQG